MEGAGDTLAQPPGAPWGVAAGAALASMRPWEAPPQPRGCPATGAVFVFSARDPITIGCYTWEQFQTPQDGEAEGEEGVGRRSMGAQLAGGTRGV